MKKLLPIALLTLLLPVSMLAQIFDPVNFKVSEKKLSSDLLEVSFAATIDDGWHVYGSDIADGGPIKAELTLDACEGAKPDGKLQEKGKAHKGMDPMFGMEVTYYEHNVTFVQRFTLTGGKYNVKGTLTYGACNDENCLPPTNVNFSAEGEYIAPEELGEEIVPECLVEEETEAEETSDSIAMSPPNDLWLPVTFPDGAEGSSANTSLLAIFFMGFLGGLLALLTPCVWPVIPMTVSFFLKRSKSGVRDACLYGLSIVVIYMLLGMAVTAIFGASALNELSTNAVFNLLFCAMLVVFAASFFGAFELTLPESWSTAVDGKA